jgi:voltage-gated potassium channel
MVDTLRWGRAARIVRILRVLRGVRSAKVLSAFILQKRTQSTFLAAGLLSIILIVISSIFILQFESSSDANINTPEDAIWWSVVTLTTVGYGDRYPVSTLGRILASLMMISGVGLFGIMSGFVASWFVHPRHQLQQADMRTLLEEVRHLRGLVESKTIAIPAAPMQEQSRHEQ